MKFPDSPYKQVVEHQETPWLAMQVTTAHWLERLDGWRKPAQVAAQLALVSRLAPERQAVLRAAWQAAQAVSPQALLSEGYRGAALGEALRQHRQKAVAGALGEG